MTTVDMLYILMYSARFYEKKNRKTHYTQVIYFFYAFSVTG